MAQVPLPSSTDINIFGGSTGAAATSIYEVVKHVCGTPASATFDAILATVHAGTGGVTINDFNPNQRPSSGLLSDIKETHHFRGFPVGGQVGSEITWHMKTKTYYGAV